MPVSNQAYTNQVLKVAVAQICQTIGFTSVQSTPMEVMIDVLHNYIRELCIMTKDFAEHDNRTEPNLNDVELAYGEMKINLNELKEYMEYVDPIALPLGVPKYPLPKESHLNFLKPGSQEVLTRPVHIPEHMPPMQPEPEEETQAEEEKPTEETASVVKEELMLSPPATSSTAGLQFFKKPPDVGTSADPFAQRRPKLESVEGRPTREISSVMMTTSGFISPAREGKLPDAKPPVIVPDKRPSPPPQPIVAAPLPVSTLPENKFEEKPNKKKSHETEKKKKVKKELFQPQSKQAHSEAQPASAHVGAASSAHHPPPQSKTSQASSKHAVLHEPGSSAVQQLSPGSMMPSHMGPALPSHMPMEAKPLGAPQTPRKPGRPRKSEQMTTPGMDPSKVKDKPKKPKNPDAKLIKQLKKQIAAGALPPLPIEELVNRYKAAQALMQPKDHSSHLMSSSMSNPNTPPPQAHQFLTGQIRQPFPSSSSSFLPNPKLPPSGFPSSRPESKLPLEQPDKSKLNIFKKLPSSKMVQHEFPSTSIKSELSSGSMQIDEITPPQKQKGRHMDDQFSSPFNMSMQNKGDFGRGSIEDLTLPLTPQMMPRTPDMKSSPWIKEEIKKKKEKPEKKIKKIKTPPLIPPTFFNQGVPDMSSSLGRMNLPSLPPYASLPQPGSSSQQPRFPFFPGLMPSGPGLIPNAPFFSNVFGASQFGGSPFNIPPLFPNDLMQNFGKLRSAIDHPLQQTQQQQQQKQPSPRKEKQVDSIKLPPQCNVAPLLPPTVLEQALPKASSIRSDSPIAKLPPDTVAIPIEQAPHIKKAPMIAETMTTNKIKDAVSVSVAEPVPPKVPNTLSAITSSDFDTIDLTSPQQTENANSDKNKDEKESKKDKKLKKKNKKKDKMKEKEKEKDRSEKKRDKEERKREKKEKRKEKERLAQESSKLLSSNTDSIDNSDSSMASVPKLTLKLGGSGDSRPNTPDIPKKLSMKPSTSKKKDSDSEVASSPHQLTISHHRESSPELAKISALVTHPPKQKNLPKRKREDELFSGDETSSKSSKRMKSPSSGGESKKHSKKHSSGQSSQVAVESVGATGSIGKEKTSKEDEGQEIWICPACGQVDNGTPMIGCDRCDSWFHWVCVGIQVAPAEDENWYCRQCISAKQDSHTGEKKKKRKKNKEKGEKA